MSKKGKDFEDTRNNHDNEDEGKKNNRIDEKNKPFHKGRVEIENGYVRLVCWNMKQSDRLLKLIYSQNRKLYSKKRTSAISSLNFTCSSRRTTSTISVSACTNFSANGRDKYDQSKKKIDREGLRLLLY